MPISPKSVRETPPQDAPRKLSVVLTGKDYVRLRLVAARSGRKHQDIMEAAIKKYLTEWE